MKNLIRNTLVICTCMSLIACNNSEQSKKKESTDQDQIPTQEEVVADLDSMLNIMNNAASAQSKKSDIEKLTTNFIYKATLLSNKYPDFEKGAMYLNKAAYMTMSVLQNSSKSYKIYNQIIKKYPDYKNLEQVYYLRAFSLDELRKKEQAVAAYNELLEKYPDTEYREDAETRIEHIDMSFEEFINQKSKEVKQAES